MHGCTVYCISVTLYSIHALIVQATPDTVSSATILHTLKKLDERMSKLEKQKGLVMRTLDSLHSKVVEVHTTTFNINTSPFKVCIRIVQSLENDSIVFLCTIGFYHGVR